MFYIKKLISHIFRKMGLLLIKMPPVPKIKFKIDEIIDVGVAKGTPYLINLYPKSFYYLIEPNANYNKDIKELLKKIKGIHLNLAAGEKKGSSLLYLKEDNSSFLKRKNFDITQAKKIVKIDTLDNLLLRKIKSNTLLKIDTEGYELKALKGAKKLLSSGLIKVVIIELRLKDIDTYNPSELISFLFNYEFLWYDIIKTAYRKNGISFMDVIFIHKSLK